MLFTLCDFFSARAETSPTTATHRGPRSATTEFSAAAFRSNATTLAPSSRNRVTIARPMPCAAPVTTTPCPVNRCPVRSGTGNLPLDVGWWQLVVRQQALLDCVLDGLAHRDPSEGQIVGTPTTVDDEDDRDTDDEPDQHHERRC